MDHGLHDLAGVLDQIHDRKQDLPIDSAELLDDPSRLLRGARHDLVTFLHGGRLLSVVLRLATRFYRIGANRRLPTFYYVRDALGSIKPQLYHETDWP